MKWNSIDWVAVILFCLTFFSHLFFWNVFPPGFTADEATEGYDAYSLLRTGKDQFGNSWPILFRSFGDYRSPLNIWITIPSIVIFGPNTFSVRLPSFLAASGEAVFIYLLGKLLFSRKAGVFSAIFFMLSPWLILHTRFAQQVNLATLTILMGVTFFLIWAKNGKNKYIIFSTLSFAISFYAYQNARITAPLLMITCFLLFRKLIIKNIRLVMTVGIIFGVVLYPLLNTIIKNSDLAFRRAQSQNVFNQPGIKLYLWGAATADGNRQPVIITRFLHNKATVLFKEIAGGYLKHFEPGFLFWKGDPHDRFQTPGSGLLNWVLIILIPAALLKYNFRDSPRKLILAWIFISPFVSALSIIVPNSQHSQDLMIPLHLLGGAGAVAIWARISRSFKILLIFAFLISESVFLYGYTKIVPFQTAYLRNWYYYGDLFDKVKKRPEEKIVFLDGLYYINLAWSLKYDPAKFQKEVRIMEAENKSEFDHVDSFGKYFFMKRNVAEDSENGVLYIKLADVDEKIPIDLEIDDRVIWPDSLLEYRLMKRKI